MTTQQHLTQLESTGLLQLAQTLPELEYLFRHALVQDAAYESLLLADRQKLHRQVGATIERLFPDRLEELSPVLGWHFSKTGEIKKAIDYLVLAAENARTLYANEEAIDCFQRSLALIQQIPATDAPSVWQNKVAFKIHQGLGDVYKRIGKHDEARAAYLSALEHVPEDNPIWQARIYRKMAYTFMMQRQDEAALQAYHQAELTLGAQPTEPNPEWWQEWIQIQLEWMEAYYWRAQPGQMAELVNKVKPAIEHNGTPTQRALFFSRLAQANFRTDRYTISDESFGYVKSLWEATQQLDDLAQRYSAQFTLGFSHLWLGNIDEAEKHLLASLASAERTGDATHQTRCLTYLAILSRKCSQQEKTQQYTSRALSLATALQMVEYTATANANLAWIAWDQKNLSDAEKYGKSALDLWPATYPFQWTALWPLVAVALTRGRQSRAVGYVRTLLEPTQQRLPAVMATELEAALLKWGNKQSLECQAHLDRAIKLAQESGYL